MKGFGVQRSDLPSALGPNLRRAWALDATMDESALRDRLTGKLEEILQDIHNVKHIAVLRVGLNIGDENVIAFLDGLELTERLKCLDEDVKATRAEEVGVACPEQFIYVDLGPRAVSLNIDQAITEHFEPKINQLLEEREAEEGESEEASKSSKRSPLLSCQTISVAFGVFVLFFGGVAYYELHSSTSTTPPVTQADPLSLTITTLSVVDGESGQSVVFPSPTGQGAVPYVAMSDFSTPPADAAVPGNVFQSELKVGAYALGGLDLTLNLESTSTENITVYNVQPVDIHRAAPLAGALIYRGSQGGPSSAQLYFDMDNVSPVAKSFNEDQTVGGPFFMSRYITVGYNNNEELEAYFKAYQGAYTFNLEVDYELNGAKHSQIFKLNGQPLAVTADLCGSHDPETKSWVSPTSASQYQLVHYMDIAAGSTAMVAGNPESWCQTLQG